MTLRWVTGKTQPCLPGPKFLNPAPPARAACSTPRRPPRGPRARARDDRRVAHEFFDPAKSRTSRPRTLGGLGNLSRQSLRQPVSVSILSNTTIFAPRHAWPRRAHGAQQIRRSAASRATTRGVDPGLQSPLNANGLSLCRRPCYGYAATSSVARVPHHENSLPPSSPKAVLIKSRSFLCLARHPAATRR